MNNNEIVQQESQSFIDCINIQHMQNSIDKISQLQKIVRQKLVQNHDFGVIPGTDKPTLLKPGAEKILGMMGLRSEFDIVDSTRDWQEGFFQYQVRCKLFAGDTLITEGLGSCNTKEKKYVSQNPFSIDNTVLKMAKKRALIDATLLVASLSDIFTQDIEDMDIEGNQVTGQKKYYTDQDGTISKAQAKRMFALAEGDKDIIREVLDTFGYKNSTDVKKLEYKDICNIVVSSLKHKKEIAENQEQN